MTASFTIGDHRLTLADLEILQQGPEIRLSEAASERVKKSRDFLDRKLSESDDLFYGINTGFGDLCDVRISAGQIRELQHNLLMSHACGTGPEAPAQVVRLMMALKIQSLAMGYSGISPETMDLLIKLFNRDILPVVYTQGSLGASGDLAPLAHLSLPLIGLGEVWYKGKRIPAAEALRQEGLEPVSLQSKEGLALINGTQYMSACLAYVLNEATNYIAIAEMVAALSLDAWCCRIEPFAELIHHIRPHEGQQITAANIRWLLRDSSICSMPKSQIQDPYSFRCIPQVHGAVRDVLKQSGQTLETEINSVTDNPSIFPEEGLILSGGNFHGEPLAFALDFLGIALAELGNISERRTFQLLSGERDLPPFLVKNSGLHSGLMIPQYTAAALVSENKQLCYPASADSIPSSNGQEDHVSMGANAANKAIRIMENLKKILAIELLTAAQAMEFRRPMQSGSVIEAFLRNYRTVVPPLSADRVLYRDIEKTVRFLDNQSH